MLFCTCSIIICVIYSFPPPPPPRVFVYSSAPTTMTARSNSQPVCIVYTRLLYVCTELMFCNFNHCVVYECLAYYHLSLADIHNPYQSSCLRMLIAHPYRVHTPPPVTTYILSLYILREHMPFAAPVLFVLYTRPLDLPLQLFSISVCFPYTIVTFVTLDATHFHILLYCPNMYMYSNVTY